RRPGVLPVTYVASRRVLHEEQLWRVRHRKPGWGAPDVKETLDSAEAGEIAEYYRSLRRAREGARDEPGAGDFYYGEMEMRRLNWESALWERIILFLYWALSGYGLRASRALTALAVIAVSLTLLFWKTEMATPPHGDSGLWPAATFVL